MNRCVAPLGRSLECERKELRARAQVLRTVARFRCSRLACRGTLLSGLIAACGSAGAGQTMQPGDPVRFWQHESEYGGSQTCKACHPDIYSRQSSSNHARSLRRAGLVPELVGSLPFSRFDRISGFTLTLSDSTQGRIRLEAVDDAESSGAMLDWAFGSGAKGITPIGRADTGGWLESRLTWYKSLGAMDFTTGASKYDPRNAVEGLGRGLTTEEVAECFSCHTTGYDEHSAAPSADEMGIRCERCHGPGQSHVETAMNGDSVDGTIFNPVVLPGFQQAQMCGACHGSPPQDNDLDALALLERTPHSVRFPSQRIVLSRCFNETFGELACTTCHDPHHDVAAEAGSFDESCLSCHDTGARENGTVCPVASANCASCHMPTERVMRHSLFSDHWIRVVR